MTDIDNVLRQCREQIARGEGHEQIVRLLRDRGISKGLSIKALVDLGLASLADAKGIVHFSATWADVRENDERFQSGLERATNLLER